MIATDWIRGDALGIDLPAHATALEVGGVDFLTRAFHAAGSLPRDNRVSEITECREVEGGSTGRKLVLTVAYEKPSASLHTDLFVKFSRDFDDSLRDRGKFQMELEVLFALVSREPAFPIAVPTCYYADFHHASGTGILITERIPFGRNGIEPHYAKCLDYQMPEPLAHYRALVRALAQLAGTHKAGLLSDRVDRYFPFDPQKLAVSARGPYNPEQIGERVQQYIDFAGQYPQLVPEHLRDTRFFARLQHEAPRFQSLLREANRTLQGDPAMIALCHWNAHIDNAWFWHDGGGHLQCGLMDWGNVSQMNVAMALWGCLSGAEVSLWNDHLDALLQLFIDEFGASGGPAIELATLKQHLTIYVAMMGLAWMLDVPNLTLVKIPGLAAVADRFDPVIADDERARTQLSILTVFLNLWHQQDMQAIIDHLEGMQHHV